MTNYHELENIVTLLNTIICHQTDDEGWSRRYNIVFSENISKRAVLLYNNLSESKFDYYDPDTSYQEDVEAFVKAITEAFKSLHKEVGDYEREYV